MTKLAYLDCPTGISGDMCLGALVDAGVPLEYLTEQLKRLGMAQEYHLWAELVHRNGQQATKVHVDLSSPPEQPIQPPPAQTQPVGKSVHQHDDEGSHSTVLLPAHSHSPDHEHRHDLSHGHGNHGHGTRHLPEITALIQSADLPTRVVDWSLAVFRQLAIAEGAVHGIPPEQVHFHEVGATDAIVDIVGTCLGLDWLNIDQLYCSALPVGGGTVWAAHGRLPVPPPAVLKLWEMRQVPIYSNGIERELVTPTGAALVTTLATQFGPPPRMTLHKVGLGAGSLLLPIPNMVRLWIGEASDPPAYSQDQSIAERHPVRLQSQVDSGCETGGCQPSSTVAATVISEATTVAVLETQIDDLNPQAIGYVMEQLLTAGALDVFTQAIGMKKSRPGILLTVICRPEDIQMCEAIVFRETTTLGIRCLLQQRTPLERSIEAVTLPYGTVRLKVARYGKQGTIVNVQPEYEDCAALARQAQRPWKEIHRLALAAWYAHLAD